MKKYVCNNKAMTFDEVENYCRNNEIAWDIFESSNDGYHFLVDKDNVLVAESLKWCIIDKGKTLVHSSETEKGCTVDVEYLGDVYTLHYSIDNYLLPYKITNKEGEVIE